MALTAGGRAAEVVALTVGPTVEAGVAVGMVEVAMAAEGLVVEPTVVARAAMVATAAMVVTAVATGAKAARAADEAEWQ